MWARIKKIIAPPVFEGDEPKTQLGALLNIVLLFNLAGGVLFLLARFFLVPEQWERNLIAAAILPLFLGDWILFQRGRMWLATFVLVSGFWTILTLISLVNGGVRSPAYPGNIVVVLMLAVLAGRRAAFGYTLVSLLTGVGLVYGEAIGLIPHSDSTPMSVLIALALYFVLVALLLHLATGRIADSLAQARRELDERERVQAALRESEERFRRLSEAAFEGIGISYEGRVIDVNERLAAMLGYRVSEMIGRNVSDFVAPPSRDLMQAHDESPALDEPLEHLVMRKDGSMFAAESRGRTIRYGGRSVRVVAIRDISERKRAEAALKESEERYRKIIIAAGLVPYVVDYAQQRFTFIGEDIFKLTGYAADEITPSLLKASIQEEYLWGTGENLSPDEARRQVRAGVPLEWRSDMRIRMKTGDDRWLSDTSVQIVDEFGKAVSGIGILQDITERKRAEEELKRRANEFAALYETANALVAQHDLRTLLQTIAQRAVALLKTHEAIIYFYDERNQELEVAAVENAGVPVGARLSLSAGGASAQVAQTRQPVRVDDYRAWAGQRKELDAHSIASLVRVPILYGGELIGILGVSHKGNALRAFTDDEVRLLSLFAAQAASAVHNARLLDETRRRANESAALYENSRDLAAERDLPKVLETVMQRALNLLNVEDGALWLYDAHENRLERVVNAGPVYLNQTVYLAMGEGVTGRVAQTRQPMFVDDYPHWEHRVPQYARVPLSSVLGVPMLYGGQLIGVVTVNALAPNTRKFTEADLRLLSLFASQAASAVHNARLLQEISARADEFAGLYETAREIMEPRDLPDLLRAIINRAVNLLNVQDGVIFLCDPQRGDLERVVTQRDLLPPGPTRLQLGEGLVGKVAQTRKPMVVSDYRNWEGRLAQYQDVLITAIIGVPLLHSGELIGVLCVNEINETTRKFSEVDVDLLELFAAQAASAVHSARLLQETRARADEFAALYETAHDLTQEHDLGTLIRTIAERATRLLNAQRSGVHFFDPARQDMEFVITTDPIAAIGTRLKLGEGLAGMIAQKRETMIVDRYSEWAQRSNKFGKTAMESVVGAPMLYRGELIGVITVGEMPPTTRKFTQDDARLLALFASHAASAVHNARLVEQLRQGREELQALSRRLLQVQEEERRALARELHDELGQSLTAIKIGLESAPRQRRSGASVMTDATQAIQKTLEQVRNLALNLRPSVLDDLGLIPALRWSFDRQARAAGWQTEFAAAPLRTRPPSEIEITCFRVAQEALTNIARHAQAKQVRVELTREPENLLLTVSDDGTGFDPRAANERASAGGSLGLLGMQERMSLVGGQLEIESSAGRGTRIVARFPWREDAA